MKVKVRLAGMALLPLFFAIDLGYRICRPWEKGWPSTGLAFDMIKDGR